MTELLWEGGPSIDQLPLDDALQRLHEADLVAAHAVQAAHAPMALAVKKLIHCLQQGGRVFSVGAGTSGRLGVLDAAELPPTFGISPEVFQGIIAGGAKALTQAIEGAEDDFEAGSQALKAKDLGPLDGVLAIAASGTTPFVHGALHQARAVGATTVFVTCVPSDQVPDAADVMIRLLCGPEVVQGSTRMKAGTATKLCLNALSTMVMVGLGKVHRGRMVDVVTHANQKLIDRGERLVMDLGGVDRARAQELLAETQGTVKPAVLMACLGVAFSEAQQTLRDHGGHLGPCLEQCP